MTFEVTVSGSTEAQILGVCFLMTPFISLCASQIKASSSSSVSSLLSSTGNSSDLSRAKQTHQYENVA